MEKKTAKGMADPWSGRFYLSLYCWDEFFQAWGIHSWETCLFPLCNDTLILYLSIPLNYNSEVNVFLGCPIGSPQTLLQLRFPHQSQTPWEANRAVCIPRSHKGEFVLSTKVHPHSTTNPGSVVRQRWALCSLSCASPSTRPCRTNPEGICSFPYAAWEPGLKSLPHMCHCWKC